MFDGVAEVIFSLKPVVFSMPGERGLESSVLVRSIDLKP